MRKSGILMHISSLPGPYGMGTMGKNAYAFVDFLHRAKQSYWQILPLCPTGHGDSPYQSFSTFAGNPYLIDLDTLVEEGLLETELLEGIDWSSQSDLVDYGKLFLHRDKVLRRAYGRFIPGEEYESFLTENGWWLEDYALFMAIKGKFSGKSWQQWSMSLMLRYEPVIKGMRFELRDEIGYQYFLQYMFFRQWNALRGYANKKGIKIIGDVPIYVPMDSADVWANPELFQLDITRRATQVAGCPPDSFSAEGQLWGNPLYNWEQMEKTDYFWWIRRLRAASRMYDVVRLDHFRGFESYWAIPANEKTAVNGTWVKGPGEAFVRVIQKELPHMEFIAEDLGYMTYGVRKLQEFSGYPGMKVMQFAFDSREDGDYIPHNYPVNSVCYSGTHDNTTLKQWFCEASGSDCQRAIRYLGLNQEEGYVWGMIRGCMSSVSRLCMIQMQDYLELDGSARMNTPGTLGGGNWTWRAQPGFITPALEQKIADMTQCYERE